MVAKRNLSPRVSPAVAKQNLRRSPDQNGRNDVVSISSHSNHSASSGKVSPVGIANPALNAANGYSEAVAHSIERKKEQYCRTKATESIIVIAVNVALSLAAIAAITRLLPYQSSQKDRLDEITTEVNSVEQRVNALRENLPQTLNSGKSQEMLLRKQGLIKSNQMTIKLLDPTEIASPSTDGVMPTTTTAQRANNR
ncbi:hypothetical protein [Pseudanabaena sp. Chao 1811]|uniref:slr1601 family putative cell division protein n=1 Tax=Pseudanabaena sp. Chao 1811 TaxID=2963092 RepID=UPI0022F3A05E|nr:hypothetical protein [Pseudanabaena sp. Chao 1811]